MRTWQRCRWSFAQNSQAASPSNVTRGMRGKHTCWTAMYVRACVPVCFLLFLLFAHTPPQVVPAPDSGAKVKENVSKAFLNARPRIALGSHNGLVRGSATHDGRDPTAAASADGVPAHLSLLARGAEQRLFNQGGVRTSTLPPFPAPVPEEPFDVAMAQLCRKPAFRK